MIPKLFLLIAILQVCYAPPVTQNKKEETAQEHPTDGLENYVEYHRYIREVVNALESDPTFREKLEKANEEDIKSGKIAEELELVSHHVRTRLDEIKRTELQRLRELVAKRNELMGNDIDDPMHHHVDHENQHTFEIEDLKKLILKTTEDLAEADKMRREEFKQYELQKEFERQDKLNHTTGEEREKLEKEYKEMEEKHKKHEKLHTPGHKQQLEEVWEEQDHMQQEFDPKTFFMLHDLDSNGLWDQDEVKALFVKELDKMYASAAPEDDMRERVEEMERMRESVFKEMDTNKDGFIDYEEFIQQTKKNDFEKDNGWQGLDEQKPYTDEELEEYIRQYQLQHPPPQGYAPPQGYHQPGYQGPPQGYPHGQGQMPHPAQMQHQDQMQYQGQQMHQQGQQMHQQGQQMHQQGQQMHQQGQQMHHQGQMPHPAQGQVPQNAQFQPGQLPQAQVNPQQIHNQGPPVPNPNVNYNQGGQPNLNTNEIYPDHNKNQQYQQQNQQYQQQNQQYQGNQQQQQGNQQQHQGNQQQHHNNQIPQGQQNNQIPQGQQNNQYQNNQQQTGNQQQYQGQQGNVNQAQQQNLNKQDSQPNLNKPNVGSNSIPNVKAV